MLSPRMLLSNVLCGHLRFVKDVDVMVRLVLYLGPKMQLGVRCSSLHVDLGKHSWTLIREHSSSVQSAAVFLNDAI